MNEVVIIVKAKNDTKGVFESIRRDARKLGDDMGQDVTVHFTERIKRESISTGGEMAKIGDTMGETIGRRVAERITERINIDVNERLRSGRGGLFGGGNGNRTTINNSNRDRTTINNGSGSDRDREHVTVDVDVNKQSLLQKLQSVGKEAGDKFTGFFGGALSTFFSGDFVTLILKAIGIGGLALGLASVLGAAISAAVLVALSGGVIGIGVAAALKHPAIMDALSGLKKQLGKVFDGFGSFFVGPVADFLNMFSGLLDDLKPAIADLGKTLGPVADELAHGVIGFLQNVLPAIMRGVKAGAPLIKTLADEMPGIGDAIGRFFDHISESAPSANLFFNDLLNIIPLVIRALGFLIEVLANMYHIFRSMFFTMMQIAADWAVAITGAASIAFGWVPGLGPKLDSAARKAAAFKTSVNKQLDGIHDVDVSVKIKVAFGNFWGAVHDMTAALNHMGYLGNNIGGALSGIANHLHDIGAIKASGGVTGMAAAGGPRTGLTWVGEHGPELVNVPAGSRVYSNPDSMRMLAGQNSQSQPILVQLVLDGYVLAQKMLDPTRDMVDRRFGGSVQAAYGRAG